MAEYVDFHYMPLEGKITGKQVLKQTEDAINDLGQHVYEIDIDDEKIQEAIDTSNQAIETAEEALAVVTTNRAVWYNSVTELREAIIDNGIVAAIKGYAFAGDEGQAFYVVREKKSGDVDDGKTIIFLDAGNVAEIIANTGITNMFDFDEDGYLSQIVDGDISNQYGEKKRLASYEGQQEIVEAFNDVINASLDIKGNAESARTSAEIAKQASDSLIQYLDTRESITAPIVDPTLTISGAAADSKVVGDAIYERHQTVTNAGLDTGKYYTVNYYTHAISTTDNTSSSYTDTFFALAGYKTVEIVFNTTPSGTRVSGFADTDGKAIANNYYTSTQLAGLVVQKGTEYVVELTVPDGAVSFFFSGLTSQIERINFTTENYTRVTDFAKAIEPLDMFCGFIDNAVKCDTAIKQGVGTNRLTTVRVPYDVKQVAGVEFTDCPVGYEYHVYVYDSSDTKRSPFALWKSGNVFVSADPTDIGFYINFRKSDDSVLTNTDADIIVNSFKAYLRYATAKMQQTVQAFVSATGNDSLGDGSENSPYATVNKALTDGFSVIYLDSGNYNQSIDLSLCNVDTLELRNITRNGRVVFEPSNKIVVSTETLVSGYTNVYSASYDGTLPSTLKWMFQDGVADVRTTIADSDRLPMQRGQEYRMLDTKITRCDADNLADALTEIENAGTDYKWFYDDDNDVLYFSRPQIVNSSNPICADINATTLFANNSRTKSVKAYGIDTKYMSFNINNLCGAELHDCKASNVCNVGAFMYDKSLSVLFDRCEACGCARGELGDGFNGHATNDGDPFAKQITASLIDCWSHDNQDDGYSDHERSETVVRGGLYENNGKGGVVPSFGSHCSCYSVISRNNENGFLYTGDVVVAEGGKYGQMLCFNCIAQNNTLWAGFRVRGAGNRVVLYDCKAIDNSYGYLTTEDSYMELIDCHSKNNLHTTSGNVTVSNTDVVL